MGGQYAICIPDKDMLFVFNGDGQGNPLAHTKVIDGFFENIVGLVSKEKLSQNKVAQEKLAAYSANLTLWCMKGSVKTDFQDRINAKEYIMRENAMNIKRLKLDFSGNGGKLCYENAQGYKELPFGINENVFSHFPEEGYSDLIGSKPDVGNRYKCAASAVWAEERKLLINVQIIDKYFGKLHIMISFKDEEHITVLMKKAAQDFLNKYDGCAIGELNK